MPIWNFNKACFFFYELALLLTVYVLAFVPFHIASNQHYNISRVFDSSLVTFTTQDSSSIKAGDMLPVYRFHAQAPTELGKARVSYVKGNEVFLSYNPQDLRWPMGRHGQVIEANASMLKVSLGSDLGLKAGDLLCLFKERQLVGKIRLRDVYGNFSWGDIVYLTSGISTSGLTVSEYTVATQVTIFKNPLIVILEVLFFVLVVLAQFYFFFIRRISLFMLFGNWLRAQYQRSPKELFHFIMNILFGVPFVWFMVNFFPRCLVYLTEVVLKITKQPFNFSFNTGILNSWFHQHQQALYIATGAIYLAVLIWKKRSPILLFWQWVAYKPKKDPLIRGVWRDIIIWSLHLVIFYAFGSTLTGFFKANFQAIFDLIWPGVTFSWNNLFHLPSPKVFAPAELFEVSCLVLRYLLWSITIVGCLFGYWYSVLGYMYGTRIRNLDFTVMGWLTNAACYGPLLGVVIFRMTPSLMGADPIVTKTPLWYFVHITELLINLIYTISIWNLGKYFGVMTDKGVRTSGFYSVVRHPSYTLEAFMFVMVFLIGLSSYGQWLAVSMFIFTYYVRSEREDNFMSESNPAYKDYQQKTTYKFIPGIY